MKKPESEYSETVRMILDDDPGRNMRKFACKRSRRVIESETETHIPLRGKPYVKNLT